MSPTRKTSAVQRSDDLGEIRRLAQLAAALYAGMLSAAPGERLPDEQRDIDRAAALADGLARLVDPA